MVEGEKGYASYKNVCSKKSYMVAVKHYGVKRTSTTLTSKPACLSIGTYREVRTMVAHVTYSHLVLQCVAKKVQTLRSITVSFLWFLS